MAIVIKAKKVVSEFGTPCREVLNIEALTVGELPGLYLENNGRARVGKAIGGELMLYGKKVNGFSSILKGRIYSEDTIQALLAHVSEAVEHLREVNETLRALRAEWNGEETFTI